MTLKNKIVVTKASGIKEPFSIKKLRHSLARANATVEEIDRIVESVVPTLYQGIGTNKIYAEAFRLLRSISKPHAARYQLKRGILELGPSGYPFERYIAELFKYQGYTVQVGQILKGKCVTHEIDVIAEKKNELIMIECKYRNQSGMSVDVKTPLYIHARFEDILSNEFLQNRTFNGWIATNSKFTSEAIQYGNCKGLKMLSWDYPNDNALKDIIDNSGLYPLTCLTSLTNHEKQWLLEKQYILVRDIYDNKKLLLKAGVKEARLKAVMDEGAQLSQRGYK